jgi:hypothetical protein
MQMVAAKEMHGPFFSEKFKEFQGRGKIRAL